MITIDTFRESKGRYEMKKYAVITMDIEDWYHTYFPDQETDRSISLLDGLDVALNIMNQENIEGSFFVVGEIADQLKDILQRMDKDGHDIACHNWVHLRAETMTQEKYKEQLIKAKGKLEEILGHEVNGYRAPSFAIDDAYFDTMRSVGFKYDSSKLKAQKSEKYGYLNLNGFKEIIPCVYRDGDFMEFEVSTQKIGSMNMLLGGGYIRMLPWLFMRWMNKQYMKTGKPYVLYIHPIDMSRKPMPKVDGISFDRYLRTHIGRRTMVRKFRKIIKMLKNAGYEFVTFEQLRNIELS